MSEIIISEGSDEAESETAAMAGAALANSSHAANDAEQAEARANVAVDIAEGAKETADMKPDWDHVKEIAREESESAVERLAALLAERLAPAMAKANESMAEEVVVIDEVPEEVKPKSVERASKTKKTFRDRYLGLGDDE